MVPRQVPGEGWRGLLPPSVQEAPDDQPIYHYTNPRGLLGMVQHKQLWATEASGMNDLAEVRQGWDFIRRWLTGQDPDDWAIQQCRELTDNADDDHPLRAVSNVFMCSASTRADDANQWRLYASGGRGYALELDPSIRLNIAGVLNPPLSRPRRDGSAPAARLQFWSVSPWLPVLYTDDEKETAVAGLIDSARTHHAQILSAATNSDHYDNLAANLQVALQTDLARLAQLMKTAGFAGENEVRILVSDFTSHNHKFRDTPAGIVRYQCLTHLQGAPAELATLPIRSVWLGPLIHAQNNQSTIEELLNVNNFYGCQVHTSDIPLRG